MNTLTSIEDIDTADLCKKSILLKLQKAQKKQYFILLIVESMILNYKCQMKINDLAHSYI